MNWSVVLAKYPQLIRNRILKVPHHGSEIYCDPENYSVILLEKYLNRNFGGRLLYPWRHLWREWIYIVQEVLKENIQPPHIPPFFSFLLEVLFLGCDSKDIYEWLTPERALIYPFKSHKLPKLGIRNQIINASRAISCTFSQKRINAGSCKQSDSCIDCYDCVEKGIPTIFEWR